MELKRGVTSIAKQVSEEAKEPAKERGFKAPFLVPTGCTLLNLALSDLANGGIPAGAIVNLVGDSQAGKSILAKTIMAEAIKRKLFKKYIYDETEHADEFDDVHLFGQNFVDTVQPPAWRTDPFTGEKVPKNSSKIEDTHMYLRKLLKEGEPFLYILDSLDGVESDKDEEFTEKNLKEREKRLEKEEAKSAKKRQIEEDKKAEKETKEKEEKVKGSYDLGIPAYLSKRFFKDVEDKLAVNHSVLIIVSQTRQNISVISFAPKRRSGGDALNFFSSAVGWLAVEGPITGRKKIPIGTYTKMKMSKNKLTGKLRKISFPIYYDYGIDDIGSMIDWLLENGFWKEGKEGIIGPKEIRIEDPIEEEDLIRVIEEKNKEEDLKALVQKRWMEIEDSLKQDRKRKYE